MKTFNTVTNIGKVEVGFRGQDLYIEHAFKTGNKDFTMRINFDKAETKQLLKMLKEKGDE